MNHGPIKYDNAATSSQKDAVGHAARIIRFNAWRRSNVPDFVFIVTLAIIIGIAAGLSAFIFKLLISKTSAIFTPFIKNDAVNWWLPVIALSGITLTGIFTRYIIKTNLTHCTGRLIQDIRQHTYRLKKTIMFSPVIGGTITLGCGGSAGAEGPIAYAGAAIGSNIGQFLGLDNRMLKILTGCGASAGIAGIFSAPIGGLMFTLELLHMELSVNAILAATAACISAYLTIFTCNGFNADLQVTSFGDYDISTLPMVIALGVFCGIYCIYYSNVTKRLDSFYKRMRNPWIRNLTGGLSLGCFLLFFPALYGPGYPVIGKIINGDCDVLAYGSILNHIDNNLPIIAAGILLCKCWAVSSTNSSGGVAGDFAPTLYAGCMAGFLFAFCCNELLGMDLPAGMFSYIAMAGVMAGAIEAPLMAIFITLEMTGSYQSALPVTICALISYCIVKIASCISGDHHRMITHHIWFARKSGSQDQDTGIR